HSFFQKFKQEFIAHVEQKKCPYGDHPWGACQDAYTKGVA
ncbi:MAG: hypothetical protein RL653_4126, partial [Pseudomonadota bacterium]